ncbi:hypothetical protein AVEN_98983-1 [Araneus ventricosus]|uniref:Reverse transcriptase domain-containing protein n=1 Tax=Araneus ventricosus TaxID=182803 RepID=A0A4Y2G4A1_ARAVE|nr:hypothetical protein AVEN_98983-1 [Araneus ventricosus]
MAKSGSCAIKPNTTNPSQWHEAIVIRILKPGKDPSNPLHYRPIALTSCLCKTFERMVNARLVFELEKQGFISPLQSGFRRGRFTFDNLVLLETQIRNAFVRRNHLVSIFFDIEKAYFVHGAMEYCRHFLILVLLVETCPSF